MRYTKRFAIILSTVFIFLSGLAISAEAQSNSSMKVRRPIIIRNYWVHNPWYSRWGWYDRWNDPYFYDPYLRVQRERYYKEKDVREARKDLREDQEKYAKDGVITAKEREKLMKRERKLSERIAKLNEFRSEHGD